MGLIIIGPPSQGYQPPFSQGCKSWSIQDLLPCILKVTLQKTNMSHPGKFENHRLKSDFLMGYGCIRKQWVFPPNHPVLIGVSIIFTIHFGVSYFLETPICTLEDNPTVKLFLVCSFGPQQPMEKHEGFRPSNYG